ncbi:MAG: amidohydrolase family protein [Thermodesulfobacteriota bacterium]|nr:amidohydrolase family protein [Thermodesulfobacteriota bacterium]
MKLIDLQTQMTTEKGALFSKDLKDFFEMTFKTTIPYYQTEDEMMNVFSEAGVKVILCVPEPQNFDDMAAMGDYIAELKSGYPDVVYGSWAPYNFSKFTDIDKYVVELDKYIDKAKSFGIFYYGAATGVPANDERFFPIYQLCNDKKVPIKISVGHTAMGAGTPGGSGIQLGTERPIPNIDDVAAKFPELTIIAAHCPWPFHSEMISVLVHKANVYNEVHGWLPKYFPEELKKEINSRCKTKIMFGSDYPFFSFDRIIKGWEDEGYKPEVIENVFYKNAERAFGIEY